MLRGDLIRRFSFRALGVLSIAAVAATFVQAPFNPIAGAQQSRNLEHLRTLELTGSRQGSVSPGQDQHHR
jgi:hypothetical protein